ncbi:hypothetical protein [Bacillus atrophaeus]|uniref:hypothetical protein n=2 Tax=Bacillus atrophaeus TaxID=1452 RepID=UPI000779F2A4|nr:hypothetical protein [Bacillus atrophaeus]KXZ13294.1 hypothetical protein AXI57_16190 [Bacillus atrophaeus]MED4806295.1 hypothetical protein [Bacillus atrophaeus]UFD97588.1 Antiterminator protein ConAn1 [Bacillus atrophaeus]GED04289.1 hypothetical protein BAT02nite_39330 [Bacillus atrophaeus]
MSKVQLLQKKMTEDDIRKYGMSVRMYDGSIHRIAGRDFINTTTNTTRPISQYYSNVRNVKNENGIIVGKRTNPHSNLLFTTEAFQPVKKEKRIYTAPKIPRRDKQVRPKNRSGRSKKVSVLLQETGYSNVQALKNALLDSGAKRVDIYHTSKGLAVVCHPDYILKKMISK